MVQVNQNNDEKASKKYLNKENVKDEQGIPKLGSFYYIQGIGLDALIV